MTRSSDHAVLYQKLNARGIVACTTQQLIIDRLVSHADSDGDASQTTPWGRANSSPTEGGETAAHPSHNLGKGVPCIPPALRVPQEGGRNVDLSCQGQHRLGGGTRLVRCPENGDQLLKIPWENGILGGFRMGNCFDVYMGTIPVQNSNENHPCCKAATAIQRSKEKQAVGLHTVQ